jgi:hypothetical protein
MINFTCTGNTAVIQELSIRPGSAAVQLMRVPGNNPLSVSYVGVVRPAADRMTVNLGELQAEFSALGNEISDETYRIEANFVASQQNSDAIYELFGFYPVGEFSFLLR